MPDPSTSQKIALHLEEAKSLAQKPFRFYVKKNPRQFFLGIASLLFTNGLDSLPPLLIGFVIDQVTEGEPMSKVFQTLGLLIIISLLISVFRYFWRIQWGQYSYGAAEDLKNKIFSKYLNLGQTFFQTNAVGKLMSLINNDVNSFRMAIGPGVLILLDALFISSFVVPLMIVLSPSLTWKTLIALPLIPIIISRIEKLIHESYKEQQDQFSVLSTSSQEILAGIRTIKSFASEKDYENKFNTESKKYENICNQVARLDAFFAPTMEIGVSIGCAILLFMAGPEVIAGTLSIGALFSFYQYIQKMIWPMTAIGIGVTFWQKGRASMDRILEVLSTENDTPDEGREEAQQFESLELKGLNFDYPGQGSFGLKNIDLTLKPGEVLGILGKTGAGKSTITDLIAGLYPVKKGSLLLNGQPLQNFKQSSLRNLITYVPQESFLFSDSIYNNTLLSSKAKESHVHENLETVQLEKEINNMPDKHKTVLGEKGINISGGQKQRLSLARGLIRQSPVLILDDSFSAIDANTEKNILSELHEKKKNQSLIIISHRLASLNLARRIIVLKDGEIEAVGTHDELLLNSPTYNLVYKNQISPTTEVTL